MSTLSLQTPARPFRTLVIMLAGATGIGGAFAAEPEINRAILAIFGKLPDSVESKDNPATKEKVDLGRMLFYEKRISKNQDLSCNSCHGLDTYGVDNRQFSIGHREQEGGRNSPSVYNAALHISQFWDGRSPDLEDQAKGPVLNPVEMAMADSDQVLKVLKSIPGYVTLFQKAFPGEKDPVTYDNFGKAVGAFERQLLTPSRFDEYLAGSEAELTTEEKRGLQLFINTGCISCHNGPAMGGGLYQKLGLVSAWPGLEDTGREQATKRETDRYYFKVPSLRNIEKTGPYSHDGSVKDLPKMVGMMAEHQLGRTFSDGEVASVVEFLKALTGELPAEFIKEPKLPESGPDTPEPDPS